MRPKYFIVYVTCTILMIAALFGFKGVEEKWSGEVTGEAVLEEMTPDKAKELCINRAKVKAIEEVAGVRIISDTFVRDSVLFSDFINAASYAWVKEVKEVRWDPIEDYRKTADSSPLPMYRVRLKALVVMDKDADPGFTVDLKLNRNTYETGDEMVITVGPSRDSYLNVFNVLSDDSVTLIFPNKTRKKNHVKKGQKVILPDRDAGEQKKLKIFNTTGRSMEKESILVIATKDDVDLSLGEFAEAAIHEDRARTGSFKHLLEKMKHIPPRDRTIAIQIYEVRAKKARE